jgi:Family of unknown function (DUF6256)
MSSNLISTDVGPIGAGYLILMSVLAVGLRLQRRDTPGSGADAAGDAALKGGDGADRAPPADVADETGGKSPNRVARRVPAGWPRFVVQTLSTALGGYVLLMAVIVLYYYGVSRVSGDFVSSAITGGLMLVAITFVVFFVRSWLAERRRRRPAAISPPTPVAEQPREGDF